MVYVEVVMSLEVTEDLVKVINRAAVEWQKEPLTGSKYVYFDIKCKREFGIDVEFSVKSGKVSVESAEIIDDEKYIWFLLRYGS